MLIVLIVFVSCCSEIFVFVVGFNGVWNVMLVFIVVFIVFFVVLICIS